MKRQPVFNGQDKTTYGAISVNNNIVKILMRQLEEYIELTNQIRMM